MDGVWPEGKEGPAGPGLWSLRQSRGKVRSCINTSGQSTPSPRCPKPLSPILSCALPSALQALRPPLSAPCDSLILPVSPVQWELPTTRNRAIKAHPCVLVPQLWVCHIGRA